MTVFKTDLSPYSFLAFWLHRLSATVQKRFEAALDEHDITVAQWNLLLFIAQERDCLPGRLVALAGIDGAAVTRGVDRLVARGYAERIYDLNDKRSVRILLTTVGHDVLEATLPIAIEQDVLWTEHLSTVSRDELSHIFKDLLKSDKISGDNIGTIISAHLHKPM